MTSLLKKTSFLMSHFDRQVVNMTLLLKKDIKNAVFFVSFGEITTYKESII